ncbi:DJ-1/PfpI family protein [Alkaliphilus transvaalensis]|uniref:DJ-1/PfpI family protein n=1 Tax=Alkaliphilus transvaalensis TaxID=114628 RepID=UPI00047DF15A|nr:DJ-1/PfpI family protein [Alkaliphilus transvaalensis]
MNIAIYLYDGYYETELCIPAMLFSKENMFTIASDQEVVTCMDGRRLLVDRQVKEVKAEEIDLLIIPGGKPIPKDDIFQLIRNCEEQGKIIGGICGGVDYLAYAGVLENRRYTSYYALGESYDFLPKRGTMTGATYESDRGIVSAKPEAYLEFALELYKLAGKLIEEDVAKYLDWFKSPNTFQY